MDYKQKVGFPFASGLRWFLRLFIWCTVQNDTAAGMTDDITIDPKDSRPRPLVEENEQNIHVVVIIFTVSIAGIIIIVLLVFCLIKLIKRKERLRAQEQDNLSRTDSIRERRRSIELDYPKSKRRPSSTGDIYSIPTNRFSVASNSSTAHLVSNLYNSNIRDSSSELSGLVNPAVSWTSISDNGSCESYIIWGRESRLI